MTCLINKETMNLKVAPLKRLLLMETMTRANKSYTCKNQATPLWSSRMDLMAIKTDLQKNQAAWYNQQAIWVLVQREQRPTTRNPLERENAPLKRETRQRNREIERNETIAAVVHSTVCNFIS